ncbi:MAG: DUF998 domain-containing protein [Chloroflexi bacterium]|nr:DUF998 domain-containing protein [Chloroflexota bacterium]MBU1752207.1 DUF998 domain-containing protein [Chloroflexota bacterium]MBU1877399.1 DUF998 domain-containing protein [Chloroflexota bacterium]
MGSLVTALAYHGKQGESYSPLNHFISELGEVGVSALAPVFNVSLFVSGLLLAVFMLSLGLYVHTRLAYVAGAVGVFSSVFCSLVGVFPMNNLSIHVPVALTFFGSGLVAVALFTLAFVLDTQHRVSRWLLVPGLMSIGSFATFLWASTMGHPGGSALDPSLAARPDIWLTTILEWSVFVTLIVWVIWVSIDLVRRRAT